MSTEQKIHALARQIDVANLPIGTCLVAVDGTIVECNRPVRSLLRLPLADSLPPGLNIRDFYASPAERDALVRETIEAEQRGEHRGKRIIEFRVNGQKIWIENFARSIRDPQTDELIGFIGCLVDITKEYEAILGEAESKERSRYLMEQMSNVLHANTTTLIMAEKSVKAARDAMLMGLPDKFVPSKADELLLEKTRQLAEAAEQLTRAGDEQRRLLALSQARWDFLQGKIDLAKHIEQRIERAVLRIAPLRMMGHDIARLCRDEIAGGYLPREAVRKVVDTANQLERLACVMDLQSTEQSVIQMDGSVRALRQFALGHAADREALKPLSVRTLVERSVQQLTGFAQSSEIEIICRDEVDAIVHGREQELEGALVNLLHNAIKYTWSRDRKRTPFVTVRLYLEDAKALVQFENFGVPISRNEIDQDLIFHVGYRGEYSRDRARQGTGIGLAEARRVARSHNGDVTLESRPASQTVPESHPNYYRQPFLTVVKLWLPKLTTAREQKSQ